jgi:hypothetical protein
MLFPGFRDGEITMSAWSKRISRYCFMALATPLVLSLPARAQDQQQPPPQAQPQPQQQPLSQQQLQQLVAPIALYPDALLAQVLTASTYPLEVTLAARWAEKNSNLKGDALEAAMQKEPWDPSVKGLTSVPQVLAMMNEKLDWTAQLGEAFLAQPNDVQTAVQALRQKAETTGNLKTGKEQKVSRMPAPQGTGYAGPPEYIVIEPVQPDYVYVPVYDPVVVYGPGYWPPDSTRCIATRRSRTRIFSSNSAMPAGEICRACRRCVGRKPATCSSEKAHKVSRARAESKGCKATKISRGSRRATPPTSRTTRRYKPTGRSRPTRPFRPTGTFRARTGPRG